MSQNKHITDYREAANKWISDYNLNINGFEILRVKDETFLISIAEIFNFSIKIKPNQKFEIILEEDDEFILDDFKQILDDYCKQENLKITEVLQKCSETYDKVCQ
eukprot:gene3384-5929_t